jgi:SAM-dependent methyltransferase
LAGRAFGADGMLKARPRQAVARRSVPAYNRRAAELAQVYESTTFENVHRGVLDVLPAGSAHVLDVGAGSGRDAAALARRGHRVTAVEPSAGLRAEAALRHADLSIEWVDDGLPGLVTLDGRSYDLVLLSAVWMHIPLHQRRKAMRRLATLLRPRGLLVVTVRQGPADRARALLPVRPGEVVKDAEEASLTLERSLQEQDALGRREVSWSTFVFRKPKAVAKVTI